jgi:hypothetical protein
MSTQNMSTIADAELEVGDIIMWTRSKSSWGRIGSEYVTGRIVELGKVRVKAKLLTGINGHQHQWVDIRRIVQVQEHA